MIGIYFLLKDKKIVYIGQSRNVERRIASQEAEFEKKILKELEAFTAQDVAELPFGSEEDILP